MKKEEFLKKLEQRLSILDENEQKKVIKKYESLIDEKIKEGKSENSAIKELGDFDKLVRDILKSYKISSSYVEKDNHNTFEGTIERFVNYIVDGIKSFITKVEGKDFRSIFEIVLYILIAMFAFWVIRLPFYIIEVVGNGLFHIFNNPLDEILSFSWSLTVNICYILLVIWIIIIILNKFRKNDSYIEEKKTSHQTKKVKEEVIPEKKEIRNVPLNIFTILVKVFVVIALLPFIFMQIGLFISVGVIITLMIKGIVLIGPLLTIIGLMFIVGALLDVIFYLTFGKGGRY